MVIAQAAFADTTWDLNATFVDGGTATGVFELNSGYTAFTAWNIVVSPGGPPGYDYTAYGSVPPAFSFIQSVSSGTEYVLGVQVEDNYRELTMVFSMPLQDSGGFENLVVDPADSVRSQDQVLPSTQARYFAAGSVTEAVPEPSVLALVVTGLAVAVCRRRHT